MTYPEFRKLIFETLKNLLPQDVSIKLVTVEKNNGCIRHAVVFSKENIYFAPTIYLEPFYDAFIKGDDIESLAKEVVHCYEQDTIEIPESILEWKNYGLVQQHIYAKLIHFDENKSFLRDKPYQRFLDFAIIAYLELEDGERFKGNVVLTNAIAEVWNVSNDFVLQHALQNTKKKKCFIFEDIVDMLGDYFSEDEIDCYHQSMNSMYVLTNKDKQFGAITICFPEYLQKISKKLQGDYYLLPASVHEWIVVPVDEGADSTYLKYLVKSINDTVLNPEEVLSNGVYLYDSASKNIQLL